MGAGGIVRARAVPRRPGSAVLRSVALATAVSMAASGAVATAVDGAPTGTVGGHVLVSPLAISLTISPTTVQVGELATARATVTNLGPAAVGGISVRLRLAPGLTVRGRQRQFIRRLASGAAGSVSWSLCGRAPGAYLVFAEATLGTLVVDSPTRLLTVTPGGGRCPSRGGLRRG